MASMKMVQHALQMQLKEQCHELFNPFLSKSSNWSLIKRLKQFQTYFRFRLDICEIRVWRSQQLPRHGVHVVGSARIILI